MSSEGEVEGVNDHRVRNYSSVVIIGGSINLIIVRESIGGSELSTGEDFPDDVKVL